MAEVVAVTGIASGGDGVGRLADGRAVFVPRTAPGERVRLRADTLKLQRRFARGEVEEILEPATHRVEPECPHYTRDRCSGCQLQHLDYASQLAAKRSIVGETLRRIGKLDLPDPEITPATEPWRYRTKISLAVSGGGSGLGFHPFDRPGAVFALTDCHIADPRLMRLLDGVRAHLALLPKRLTRLTLRLDREGRLHLIAESPGEPWDSAALLLREVGGDSPVVCWWQPVDGAPRVVAGEATGFPPTAFEQINPTMGRVAREWAVDQLGEVSGVAAWDLYGGVGDTAVLLSSRGARVVSVDADEKAIEWARRRPEILAAGVEGKGDEGRGKAVRLIAARVEDVLGELPEPDVVIMNPPPGGVHWDVSLRLSNEPVRRLAYISCDPATLARDLHRLSVNYDIRAFRAFDLFPQTAHVETVVAMEAV